MGWLMDTYLAGDHAKAWRALDRDWVDGIDFDLPSGRFDAEDIDALMRETFQRVARNVDRLIEELRATGYQFESETGHYGVPQAPRRPVDKMLVPRINAALSERFADLPGFDAIGHLPAALTVFAQEVGEVDLAQSSSDEGDRPALSTHDKAVLGALGDWDPFCFEMGAIADSILEGEAGMIPTPAGGLGLLAEFAPSFEHKANVSGAVNPHIYLPNVSYDPIVFAEGVRMTFTTYLRTMFARGGFLGVPRPLRADGPAVVRLPDGMKHADHRIFATLAQQFEPF